MKPKLTFLLTAFLLMTGLSSWGQARAQINWVAADQGYTNGETIESVDFDSNVSGAFNKGTNNNAPKYYNTGSAIRCYGGNYFTITTTSGNLTEIAMTFASGEGTNAITTDVGTYDNGTWTGSASSVTFTIGGTSGHRRIAVFDITYSTGGGSTPTINANNQSIAYDATSGSIPYTISNPTGATLNASCTADWVSNIVVNSSAVTFNTTANTASTERTAIFTLTYTGAENKTVTVTQAAAPVVYTSIPALFAAATSTSTNVSVTFNNWVISAVKGSNAYLTDNEGNGLIIYQSGHGFQVNDVLSGTASCKLVTYQGSAELTNLKTTNEGLTVTPGGTVTEQSIAISDLGGVNTGALLHFDALTYNGMAFVDASNNTIEPYTQLFSGYTLEANKVYNVTGIYKQYTTTTQDKKQILPRSAADIVEVTASDPELTVSVTALTGFAYTETNGPSTAQNFTVAGSNLTANVTVTAPTNFEVCATENGTYNSSMTITASGTLAATTVYVRMAAGLSANIYSGNLTVGSTGATTQNVALSGEVSTMSVVATPTFSPNGGNYLTSLDVTINCETEGSTIHYTLDGTTPTAESAAYSTPITVSATTTIKAIAVASGYQNSTVAEATYTINETITIAAARALANNEYACVEGTVILIDGRNVHIQDATAGIDLYLNSNTVPSTLAVGDIVRAYGKKTVYNNLVELTGINGGNTNVFSVISTGNPLPTPAVQTIAAINSDFSGSNMMQSTRVTIENAIIGTINTNGNTTISQGDANLVVYRIPDVPGMTAGDQITLTGIVSCYNGNLQLRVISADDIQFTHGPTMTASPASITGLTYAFEQGGPSDIASFALSANYLTGNVSIYPSENFEVSTFGGSSFHPEEPAMVFTSTGHFTNINIYVRMKANLEGGTYAEQVYAVSEGADTLFINVTGTVTGGTPTPPDPPTPPTPGDGNYVRINDLSSLTAGSYVVFAARFDSNATDYYAMSNASSGKPTGVLFTSATSGSDEVLPASIVDEEDNYYWTVGVTANGYTFTNANNDLIGYTSGTNFATGGDNTEWAITIQTSEEGAMVPNYTGFVVGNVNNAIRAFALNNNHNFGPYHTQNMGGSNYNFYLDIFVKTEGGVAPTPTVATPTFTPAAGTYFEEQTVTISCTTEGATIYYSTTSSSGPWTAYTSPIAVNETMTIWAYAEKDGYNNSAVAEATYIIQMGFVTIFNQDWEGEMNGWTFVNVEGEMEWTVAAYQGNHYAYANGYNHGANIDWCISPAFNLNAYSNPVLSFRTAKNYTGNDLEVYFSNNYDGSNPASATWQPLTCDLSQGSWDWVESGDIDLSTFSGANCYIGFKYTCEESSAAGWEVDDILLVGQTSDPVVTVTPLALTGFTYIEGNGPSDEQSFTVSGFNLTGNVTINNAAHYEISLTSGTIFNPQNTITLTPVAGNIEETTIYVRLMAGLSVGNYNDEDITVNCVDVEDTEVTCSGYVTEQPVPGGDYVRIFDPNQLVAGNRVIIAARYNENADAYLAAANTVTSGKLVTTAFTSQMNGSDEIIPASIMADEDSYYWTVGITSDGYTFTNANGDVIGYGNSGTNFVMNSEKTNWTIETGISAEGALVPNYTGLNIVNAASTGRAFALRVTESESVLKAYATSNMNNAEYNFFLDIFMQGEGGVPPTPTVATPTFTPAAGTYYETIDVTISCATDGATIYYSLDSETGPWDEYDGAITVDENMTIWAYATKTGYNNSAVASATYVIQSDLTIIFWQEWEDDWDPWHGWTEVCQEGDSLWRVASYGGNHYAYANGYNHPATIDWLISPAFDLDSYSDVVLTFNTAKNYNGPDLEVCFSNNYDGQNPGSATWITLPCELSQGGWNWVASGDISLDEFSGSNCYIGFKYTSDEDAAGWEVDDIKLASGSTSPTPTLIATPNYLGDFNYIVGNGPSESQSYVLSGVNLQDEGYIHIVSCSWYEISLDNETFTEVLEFPCTELPATVYVRMMEGLEPNTYDGVYIANIYGYENYSANVAVNVSGVVHYENEPMMNAMMPLYIQGNNGSNNNRVPVAIPVQFANLEPNTTYHYTNQFVVSNDGPETAGAGNVIYVNPDGFYRSTSPSLSTEGSYGVFTTDEEGYAFVWLMNEPTANTRFTPGNHVYLRVRLNDGAYGVNVLYTFTSEDYATVLNFGNENDEYSGTAFYAKSSIAPMSFAMMFAEFEDPRPVYCTNVETTGVDFGSINQYANFYKEEVAGNDGWFGGILPNVNETGITYIAIATLDGLGIYEYSSEDGQWAPEANTVNPNAGLDEPIFIDLTDDGVDDNVSANVTVWSTDRAFVIENGDDSRYTMNVVNMLGQTLMSQEIAAGSTVRVSHNLVSGIYIISLQNNQNKVAVKVMVK